MDLCFEDESFRVHQQVTLTTLDLLTSVVTTLFSAYCGRFDRLRIHYARAGLGIPLQTDPQTFPDGPVDLFPGTVYAPGSEVVVNGRPSRKVVRE
jgi:hypothetical protein